MARQEAAVSNQRVNSKLTTALAVIFILLLALLVTTFLLAAIAVG
jgi:hypothetical protein